MMRSTSSLLGARAALVLAALAAMPRAQCPDLVVSSLTVTELTATTISYRYAITNIGDAPANLDGPTASDLDNVSVQAYASTDAIYSPATDLPAGGSILGSSPLGFLAPNATFVGSFTAGRLFDPATHPFLVLECDVGNSVLECNESNNTASAPMVHVDLVVSQLTVTGLTPTSITYRYAIKNVGTAPANLDGPTASDLDNVAIQTFVSSDTIYSNGGDIPSGGSILGLSPLGFLAPGQTFVGTLLGGLSFDRTTHPFLVIQCDHSNSVLENDETNNTASTAVACIELGSGGCAGSNGLPFLAPCPGSVPRSGATFCVNAANLSTKPTDAVFIMIGVVPLAPLPLDVIGMFGCVLRVNPIVTQVIPKVGSIATWQLTLGPAPAAIGVHFFTQVFAVDTNPAPNPFNATVSSAIESIVFM